jgi:hypothetical protein
MLLEVKKPGEMPGVENIQIQRESKLHPEMDLFAN